MSFPEKQMLVEHYGNELCKVANHRFGYQMGLKIALEHLGIEPAGIEVIMKLCRNRDLFLVEELIKKCLINDK